MFVSRRKLKALVDENVALKKQNRELIVNNKKLFDNNFDLRWENKMLRLSMCRKQRQKFGEYFYTGGQGK
jgi:hypothetical protein